MFLDRSRDQLLHLVEPVNQSLRRFEEQVQAIEKTRAAPIPKSLRKSMLSLSCRNGCANLPIN